DPGRARRLDGAALRAPRTANPASAAAVTESATCDADHSACIVVAAWGWKATPPFGACRGLRLLTRRLWCYGRRPPPPRERSAWPQRDGPRSRGSLRRKPG